MLSRRRFIAASTSAVALAALGLPPSVLAADGLKLAKAQPFSHDALIAQARALAARPYIAPPVLSRAVLERIDYEAHGKIKFKIDDALFVDGPGAYPVTFFHLGRYFQVPVHMHVLDPSSEERRVGKKCVRMCN